MVPLFSCHPLIITGVLRETNPILYIGEICCYPTSHLPLGVTNEGREAIIHFYVIKQISGAVAGDSECDKIGQLHTIFYLCFLVLLVYLSVFTFVSFTK